MKDFTAVQKSNYALHAHFRRWVGKLMRDGHFKRVVYSELTADYSLKIGALRQFMLQRVTPPDLSRQGPTRVSSLFRGREARDLPRSVLMPFWDAAHFLDA